MAESVLKILRKDESKGDRPGAGQPSDEQPLAADPKPKAGGGGRRQKATAAQVRAISEELTVGLKFFAGAWSMRDQHCAPVLNEHAKAISAELASILAESPRVLAWFEGVSGIGSWVKLLIVVEPVVSAIMDHHVFRRDVSRETTEEGFADGATADDWQNLSPYHPGERYSA